MNEPPTEISVVIADDDPLVCSYLQGVLDATADLRVVGLANDGAEAVDVATRTRPAVVLMDVRMPGVNGVDATRELTRDDADDRPAVVLMTSVDSDQALVDGLRAGANGFTVKTAPVEMITAAVRAAAQGADVLSPEATARLLELTAMPPAPIRDPRLAELPDREREVLRLIGEGQTNAGIARSLYLAESTVKGHVSRLMSKLDCTNRTQLALLAGQLDGS
ncbi:response regulator transcription factor [Microlunatus soli]|nr:response regulator transcription factor [Microlunatus soli]